MKKLGLIFFTLLTDLFTILAITSLFWITAASSSGFLLAKYLWVLQKKCIFAALFLNCNKLWELAA